MQSNDFEEDGWIVITDFGTDTTVSNGEMTVSDTEDRSNVRD